MESYKFVNAHGPSLKEQRERNEAYRNFKYHCFLTESILIVGDMHFFYNDIDSLASGKLDLMALKSFTNHLKVNSKENTDTLPKGWEIEEKYWAKDQGDFAWFFKKEDGKLKYFASWTIGSLGLVDWEDRVKGVMSLGQPNHYKNHTLATDEWIKKLTTDELEEVNDRMAYFLEEIQSNGYGHMALTGTLEEPSEDDEE